MSATRIMRDRWGPKTIGLILVAAMISGVILVGTAPAKERDGRRGERVVARIDIDSDGLFIRTGVREHGEDEDLNIMLNGDLVEAISSGELRCLRRAGIFDIHDCDDDDIVRFGKDIHIRAGKKVKGSVVAIGGSVFVEGRVYGDVVAVGGSVTLDDGSHVKGDAVTVAGDLELLDGCYVRGDAVAVGGDIDDEEGAHVGGDIVSMDFSLW